MDLTPVYDLRERLKTGAIAGTGLITEDFRLARALEGLAPFEAASPVFAKLGQSVRAVVAPDCADRAGALLDALSLCDAVLTTQAATAVQASVEPMAVASSCGNAFSNAPYSALSPLLEALTTSGGGRYSLVVDTHQQNPALFSDYRIKNAMVTALGASYAELADQVAVWLKKDDPSILPLLKKGFDPKGKREMVRRIEVIEAIAGGAENEFYLSLLEDSEKEIKSAAIYALRHSEQNVETLLALTKTEKGNVKKMAQWALAQLGGKTAWDYWETMFVKKPAQAAEFMILSSTEKASEAIGKALLLAIEPLKAPGAMLDKERYQLLRSLLYALPGKNGPAILAFYREAAALKTALDQPAEGEKHPYYFCRGEGYRTSEAHCFSEFIPLILASSLLYRPTDDLLALSDELFAQYGSLYALPTVTGALLCQDADTAYQKVSRILSPGFSLFGTKKEEKEALKRLRWLLEQLSWTNGDPIPSLSLYYHNPAAGEDTAFSRRLFAPLDRRWYLDAIEQKGEMDDFLIRPYWPEDAALRQALAKHFHQMCRRNADNLRYLRPLSLLGWTDYDGLFSRFCESKGEIDYWVVYRYLDDLPISREEKIRELEALLLKIENKKIKVRGQQNQGRLRQMLEELRQQANT